MVITRNVPVREVHLCKVVPGCNLRSVLECKCSQREHTEGGAYFSQHAEASGRLRDSETASLKESLQKDNEKLRSQEVPKTRLRRLLVLPFRLLPSRVLVLSILCLMVFPPRRDDTTTHTHTHVCQRRAPKRAPHSIDGNPLVT